MAESLQVQLSAGAATDRKPLVLLPKGVQPPDPMPKDATVVTVSRMGFEVQLPGEEKPRVLSGAEWTRATGWLLRPAGLADSNLRDATDWAAPELRVLSKKGGPPKQRVMLPMGEEDEFVVGRDKDCDLVLEDTRVSRRHIKVVRQNGRHFIEDLWSKSGTFLNGEKIGERRALQHEDRIQAGRSTLQYFSLLDALEAPPGDQGGEDEFDGEETIVRPDKEKTGRKPAAEKKAAARKKETTQVGEPEPEGEESGRTGRPWWENAVLVLIILALVAAVVFGAMQIFSEGS